MSGLFYIAIEDRYNTSSKGHLFGYSVFRPLGAKDCHTSCETQQGNEAKARHTIQDCPFFQKKEKRAALGVIRTHDTGAIDKGHLCASENFHGLSTSFIWSIPLSNDFSLYETLQMP